MANIQEQLAAEIEKREREIATLRETQRMLGFVAKLGELRETQLALPAPEKKRKQKKTAPEESKAGRCERGFNAGARLRNQWRRYFPFDRRAETVGSARCRAGRRMREHGNIDGGDRAQQGRRLWRAASAQRKTEESQMHGREHAWHRLPPGAALSP
jgi:hypothetical protein